jgi:hypothetical protein
VIKSRGRRGAGNVAYMGEKINEYRFLLAETGRKETTWKI